MKTLICCSKKKKKDLSIISTVNGFELKKNKTQLSNNQNYGGACKKLDSNTENEPNMLMLLVFGLQIRLTGLVFYCSSMFFKVFFFFFGNHFWSN